MKKLKEFWNSLNRNGLFLSAGLVVGFALVILAVAWTAAEYAQSHPRAAADFNFERDVLGPKK
jgi:Ni/Fe-hydrogenase subunit HybB-like protein